MRPATRVGSQLGTRYSSTPFTKRSRSSEPQLSRNGVAGVRLFRFEGAVLGLCPATSALDLGRGHRCVQLLENCIASTSI